MILYLFAGPNGSGKSTIIANYIKKYNLHDVEYVCPDVYAATLFSNVDDVYERYSKAMDFAEYKRNKLLSQKAPLIVETVLSRADKLDFVRQAKDSDYRIISVFVSTNSPDINVSRVKKRVTEGGHDVPEDKLRERYCKSMKNLTVLAEISDEIFVYDNTSKPTLVSAVINGVKFVSENAPEWAVKLQ